MNGEGAFVLYSSTIINGLTVRFSPFPSRVLWSVMTILQWAEFKEEYIKLKFSYSIDTSTLVNSNFTLLNEDATPHEEIDNPFDEIEVVRDYQSIGRILYLYWNTDLDNYTDYILRIEGLKSVSGASLPSEDVPFHTLAVATPNFSESPFTKEPTNIEDYSIKLVGEDSFSGEIDSDDGGSGAVETLSITSVSPDSSDNYFLWFGAHDGLITVVFNRDIHEDYLDSQYFRLQRKCIASGTLSTWQDVDTSISFGLGNSTVWIQIAGEENPLYPYDEDSSTYASFQILFGATPGEWIYWQQGYKYRLVVSGAVEELVVSSTVEDATNTHTLGNNKTYYFLGALCPLYLDPEIVLRYFPEGDLIEITELIHWHSKSALQLLGSNVYIDTTIQQYILAAVLCDLSKIYLYGGGLDGFSNSGSFTLGDLRVDSGSQTSFRGGGSSVWGSGIDNWCDLAALVKDELTWSRTGLKAANKGSNYASKIPNRELKRLD